LLDIAFDAVPGRNGRAERRQGVFKRTAQLVQSAMGVGPAGQP